uniref:Uncharacterized protein n=1 Tax=Leersia perrieri TaxID=77586 RepID=A0A0D9VZU1_9ORYZ
MHLVRRLHQAYGAPHKEGKDLHEDSESSIDNKGDDPAFSFEADGAPSHHCPRPNSDETSTRTTRIHTGTGSGRTTPSNTALNDAVREPRG